MHLYLIGCGVVIVGGFAYWLLMADETWDDVGGLLLWSMITGMVASGSWASVAVIGGGWALLSARKLILANRARKTDR